jgi:tetratricopeptide (TPR) repeat protein
MNFRILLTCLVCLILEPAAAQEVRGSASVLSLQGRAEYRANLGAPWQALRVNQQLEAGQWLRTAPHSRVALLLTDRTQVRLNQNSVLEILAIGAKPLSPGQTKFRQLLGRSWVQSKTPPKNLTWVTPTAVAGLRGTDWEVEVAEDGRSVLSVFHGEVSYANDAGEVIVQANEQAVAEQGKAPVKRLVRNLKDRVQWVTAYQVEPLRHIWLNNDSLPDKRARLAALNPAVSETAHERGNLLADLNRWTEAEQAFKQSLAAQPARLEARIGLAWAALWRNDPAAATAQLDASRGEEESENWQLANAARLILAHDITAALTALHKLIDRPASQPAAHLILADLMAYEGRIEAALSTLDTARQAFPESARVDAMAARLHLLNDQVDAARAASDRAIGNDLADYSSWLVRGDIERREGRADAAFAAYGMALSLNPGDDRAWFGRGNVFNEREYVREARADLDAAIARNPSGLGYQGERGTLETFANEFDAADTAYRAALDAQPADFVALTGLGLMELKRGNPQAALDAFLKASVMEPRYARVHVYTAAAYYKLGDVKQARGELARAAELDDKDPLPYFMSALLLSDQFSPAEAVEAAREAMRRLPWLKSLNQLANDPQGSANLGQAFAFMGMEEWARSYAENAYNPLWASSHLFLADRYSGLFSKNSELFQGLISDPTVFGASNRNKDLIPSPGTHLSASLRASHASNLDGISPQIAFSGYQVAPKPLAWYLGYENFNLDLLDRPFDLDIFTAAFGVKPRHDIGAFVFADVSQLDNNLAGDWLGTPFDLVEALDTRRLDIGFNYKLSPVSQIWFKGGRFSSKDATSGALDGDPMTSATKVALPELALRHSFETDAGHQISWGIESGKRHTEAELDVLQFGFIQNLDVYDLHEDTWDAYLSGRFKANPDLTLQADLFYQHQDRRAEQQTWVDFGLGLEPGLLEAENLDQSQFSPRLGLVWRAGETTHLRFAYQNWLRPAAMSSLGPVATAGIPLDDRLVSRGGELTRFRLQGEWEANPRTFLTAFADHKKIDNHPFSIRPFAVSELESLGKLRPRDYGSLMREDVYDFISTPSYAGGNVISAGAAINRMLGKQWGLLGRYTWMDSENRDNADWRIPRLPRHTVSAGATWIAPSGWYVAGLLTWRDDRFFDEANTLPLAANLTGNLDVFWESRAKHWLFRLSADQMFDRNAATQYTAEMNYRF